MYYLFSKVFYIHTLRVVTYLKETRWPLVSVKTIPKFEQVHNNPSTISMLIVFAISTKDQNRHAYFLHQIQNSEKS